jgi:hypothetical protein
MLDESQALRSDAIDTARKRTADEQRPTAIGDALLVEARRVNPEQIEHIDSALVAIGQDNNLADGFAGGIRQDLWTRLEAASVVALSQSGIRALRTARARHRL